MLDVQGLRVALAATEASLEAAAGDPNVENLAKGLLDALRQAPDAAFLGCVLGPLLAEIGPGEVELDLLRRSAVLWQRGLRAAEELHTARVEFELSLARDDLPDALHVLQMGLDRLAGLQRTVADLVADARAMKDEIDPLPHLPPHPRQADVPSQAWTWADAFAGRRGRALVEVALGAVAEPRRQALAVGIIAAYSGHVAGSAWIGAVVGGPRRLHRFRDRLARNAVGTALRRAAGTPTLGELPAALSFEGREGPELPQDLADALAAALQAAFPGRPLPDLKAAHVRLVEHLGLMSGFVLPPLPEAPPVVQVMSGQVAPLDAGTFGTSPDDGTVGGTIGDEPQPDPGTVGSSSGKEAAGDGCLGLLILIITFGIAYGIWCIGRTSNGEKCGIEDFIAVFGENPPEQEAPQATQQMLETLREPANTAHILNDIYQLELRVWNGLAAARSFLLVCGLIPPSEEDLALSLFGQFIALPADVAWPHAEDLDAATRYERQPTTPTEDPASPLPISDRPLDWLLRAGLGDIGGTICEVVLAILGSGAPALRERVNHDLDADRGRLHPAWSVAPGTSIRDQPLSVAILPFEEA